MTAFQEKAEDSGKYKREELKWLEGQIANAERCILAWQIRGQREAIAWAAHFLRDDTKLFGDGHRRIQEAILDLHSRNIRINAAVILRQLVQTPGPQNEPAYVIGLGRGAPPFHRERALLNKLADSHGCWRVHHERRNALLGLPPPPWLDRAVPEQPDVEASANENAAPAKTEKAGVNPNLPSPNLPGPSLPGPSLPAPSLPAPRLSDVERPQRFAEDRMVEPLGAAHAVSNDACRFQWVEPFQLRRRSFLLNNHAARGFVSGTIAPGGLGKTALVLAECLGLATGTSLFAEGRAQPRHNAWYIGLEDSLDEYRRRIAAAAMLHRLDPAEIEKGLFLNIGQANNFVMTERVNGGVQVCRPVADAITQSILKRDIALVVVDPFVASHRAAENDNGAIANLIRTWSEIAALSGAAIELVHHTRKSSGEASSADDARGASALVNAMRSVRMLVPMSDEEGNAFEVYDHNRYFKIVPAKTNLALRGREPEWRELISVPLGNVAGISGDQDWVGAVRRWDPPPLASDEQLEEIKARIQAGRYRLDPRAAEWVGKPVAQVLGLDLKDDEDRAKVRHLVRNWIRANVLKVDTQADANRHTRQYVIVRPPPQEAEAPAKAA